MEQTQASLPKTSLMFCSGRHYLFAAFITCNILLERQVANICSMSTTWKIFAMYFHLQLNSLEDKSYEIKQTERSHKNGATHQHPGNTRMLSKLDATSISMERREVEGWHSGCTQFKIWSTEPGLVKVICLCPVI